MLENLSKLPRLFKNKVLTIRWFLFLWRTTGKINYLRFLRKRFGIQLTAKQIAAILTHIRQKKDCKLLVFGLGNDSLLWAMANRHGKTVFIEDNKRWFNKIKSRHPALSAFLVSYQTKRREWKNFIDRPDMLQLDLGPEIMGTKWDVIIVDAPAGFYKAAPGRMKSIYMASQLANNGGDIFVHDCHREVERIYCDTFLLPDNLINEIAHLRHYRQAYSISR
jgi:glucuronoxylan 4-O-methyltransferase